MLLEAKNINISFSGIQILFDVDFQLNAGEINCLLGENGAGKTTLIKIFTGINSEYTGELYLDGQPVDIRSPRDAIQNGIYAVQQHRDLAPSLDAVENMFLGNEIYVGKSKQKLDFKKMRELAKEYIARFGIEVNLDVPVRELKLSEQGVIAICKAMVAESKILIIDEASAPLDDSERVELYDMLRQLAKAGTGIVYITHHLDEVFRIGDTITVLRDGRNAAKFKTSEVDKAQIVKSMTGNIMMYSREDEEANREIGETVIEIENLSSGKDLENVSLTVRKGEILGIAGLEGSGKDVIAKCCFGSAEILDGTIKVKGEEIRPKLPIDSIKNSIGLVPNDRKVTGILLVRDVKENIIITAINKENKGFSLVGYAETTAKKHVAEMNIKCASTAQLIEYLSGGNQQKALIAKWVEADVDILFMIEPTEGIDVGARSELYKVFRELVRRGKTIIIATSDVDELLALSDRIITMFDGKIVGEYDYKDITKQEIMADILSVAS